MNATQILSSAGFPMLTAVFAFILLRLLGNAIRQTSWTEEKKKKISFRLYLSLGLWFVALTVASLSGVASDFSLFPFNIGPLMMIPLIIIVFSVFSKNTSEILAHVSIKSLSAMQVFRFFVEIVLWLLFLENISPVQMTFEGRNFDILAGITGPIVALLFSGNRKFMIAWNFICLGLLLNILTVAILSMPTPLRVFMNDPSNTFVARFPFIFLPGFLVPLAYTLHFLSLKKLMAKL